ncbi:MAG: hypothetical protein ACHQT8_07525 [Chlamydiales bacterium]
MKQKGSSKLVSFSGIVYTSLGLFHRKEEDSQEPIKGNDRSPKRTFALRETIFFCDFRFIVKGCVADFDQNQILTDLSCGETVICDYEV